MGCSCSFRKVHVSISAPPLSIWQIPILIAKKFCSSFILSKLIFLPADYCRYLINYFEVWSNVTPTSSPHILKFEKEHSFMISSFEPSNIIRFYWIQWLQRTKEIGKNMICHKFPFCLQRNFVSVLYYRNRILYLQTNVNI